MRTALTVVAAALAFAGCGSTKASAPPSAAAGHKPAPVRGRDADRGIARRSLVVLSDLPNGWIEAEPDPNLPQVAACPVLARQEQRARVSLRPRRTFKSGERLFKQRVFVYSGTTQARRGLRALSSAGTRRCNRSRMQTKFRQTLKPRGVSVGDVAASVAHIPAVGVERRAQRYRVRLVILGRHTSLHVHAVEVRVGRVLSYEVFINASAAFGALRDDLWRTTARDMQRALRRRR